MRVVDPLRAVPDGEPEHTVFRSAFRIGAGQPRVGPLILDRI